jgi:2-dehydropantoate 2-reductase
MTDNPIYIIGTGAIGKSLAIFLKRENKNVVLIRGSFDDNSSTIEHLTVELHDKSLLKASVEISTLSKFDSLHGLIVLTTKSFGNSKISQAIRDKIGHSPLVVMQNGLDVEQPFADNGFKNIYRCVLFATSQVLSPGTVRFKPVSFSLIGTINGDGSDLETIVNLLDSPHFRFKAAPDIQSIIWKKAIANCVFNSICPLLDIDNGVFHRNETAISIGLRVIRECVTVAKALDIDVSEKEVLETVLLISKSSDGQLISTLQDIKNKRETEIESLNFAIVKLATALNKSHLVTETKLLGELTKLKSHEHR